MRKHIGGLFQRLEKLEPELEMYREASNISKMLESKIRGKNLSPKQIEALKQALDILNEEED